MDFLEAETCQEIFKILNLDIFGKETSQLSFKIWIFLIVSLKIQIIENRWEFKFFKSRWTIW